MSVWNSTVGYGGMNDTPKFKKILLNPHILKSSSSFLVLWNFKGKVKGQYKYSIHINFLFIKGYIFKVNGGMKCFD